MDGECVLAFKQNIPFVCTEIHNREHQPHKIPLQAPEPLLSSKRDPCRALLLHMTPGPPGNAVPGALKHTQQRWDEKMAKHLRTNNKILLAHYNKHYCTYGQSGPACFCQIFLTLCFSSEPKAATRPAPLLASELQATAAPEPALAADHGHLPLLQLSDPTQTQTHQTVNIMHSKNMKDIITVPPWGQIKYTELNWMFIGILSHA